ncbi:hypothetical protein FBEOM_4298, partial [Fusarium beomiforme]
MLGSMVGNLVVGVPVTPASEGKDGDTDQVEQVFYSVQCEAGTWGVASHCQAWCNGKHLNFNHSRCPIGSHNADDLYSDCYCVGE